MKTKRKSKRELARTTAFLNVSNHDGVLLIVFDENRNPVFSFDASGDFYDRKHDWYIDSFFDDVNYVEL